MKHPRNIPFILLALITTLQWACFRQAPPTQENAIASVSESHRIAPSTVDDLYQLLAYREVRYPLVSAHRGGPAPGYPENALVTFERIANIHPVIIECDIQMTRDSVLVLLHDERLDRTTDSKGQVSELDYEHLKGVRLRDQEGTLTEYPIPTLSEALQWGAGRVIFTLDVKRGVPYDRVLNEIRKNNAEAYSVVITYNANQAVQVHRLAPDVMISASIHSEADLRRLNRMGIPNQVLIAFVGTREASQDVYKLLHSEGISTILGTMGNLDTQAERQGEMRYTELVRNGADILSTDRPIEAGNALKELVKSENISSPFIQ